MLSAKIAWPPNGPKPRYARVDLVKQAVGQTVLADDHRFWILGDPLVVTVSDGTRVEVEVGFTTDGASVPEWAQRITAWKPWDEPQRWAGIVHDWLYCQQGTSKAFGDKVFHGVLMSEKAGWFKTKIMYAAVVVGGADAYHRNQANGLEGRIWV